MNSQKISDTNRALQGQTPQQVIQWALSQNEATIVTTNFGPQEAVILHMVQQQAPDLPVICVDTGYNTDATYRFAEKLIARLQLNMHYFSPRITRQRQQAVFGGIPDIADEAAHQRFTEAVKLEPFRRAMAAFKPAIWLTAIRKEQTPLRDGLDRVSFDKQWNCLKVAPLFYWSELDMEEYLVAKDLPWEEDYFDPTKVLKDRECGLHIAS